MARCIKLDPTTLEKQLKDYITDCFTEDKASIQLPKPKVKFEKKPKLQFTAEVYVQMKSLVAQCSEEIAWLGRVIRENMTFTIDKLYVFPQIVTGASVTPDETEYVKWNMSLSTEEINSIRFHGHSHVNMGVFASGTDTNMYNTQLAELKDNDFYIFLITNKKGDMLYWIYDLADNIVYDKEDISFDIVDFDGDSYRKWADSQISLRVAKHTPKYNYTKTVQPTLEELYSQFYEDNLVDEDDINAYLNDIKKNPHNISKKKKKHKKRGGYYARPN